jgi:cell division protein FtsW
MLVDYRKYQKGTKPALILCVLLLLVTLGLGGEVKGASRWLRLGGFGLQPSELAKFVLIFHLAALMAAKGDDVRDWKRGYLPLLIWIGVVALLVLLQPSFSTGAMIVLISIVMLYLGGVRLSHLLLTAAPIVPAMLLYMVSAPYRMKRVVDWVAGLDGTGAGMHHQVFQGIIGFGNGGIFGLGPGMSRQRELFLPESYGDFVFSILGEEYGLVGTLVLMTLYLIIMLRGWKIARHARDPFGRNLAYGITASVALYALVNAGVTLGLLPTTGLPMPFISYGGSSLVFSAAAIGVLLNISAQTDLHPRLVTGVPDTEGPPAPAVGKVY